MRFVDDEQVLQAFLPHTADLVLDKGIGIRRLNWGQQPVAYDFTSAVEALVGTLIVGVMVGVTVDVTVNVAVGVSVGVQVNVAVCTVGCAVAVCVGVTVRGRPTISTSARMIKTTTGLSARITIARSPSRLNIVHTLP
jgi:hypothetical protein